MFNKLLFIFLLWSIIITEVSANDIYINQVGDGIDVDIVQDGSNNRVSRKEDTVTSTPNKATFIGKNQTLDVTQTGNNNFLGLYKHYYIDAKQACSEGSYCIKDEMILNVYMADDNNIKLGQGYKISESGSFQYDGTEKGGHEMDLYVSGDRNDIMLSQRSQNTTSGHYMDVNIYSDDNDVHVIQESNSTKTLNLTINNDDNNVFVHQKKSHSQTATISLSGAYGTDLSLQMGSNQSTQAGSYSITQDCQTVGGCAVSVVQN